MTAYSYLKEYSIGKKYTGFCSVHKKILIATI